VLITNRDEGDAAAASRVETLAHEIGHIMISPDTYDSDQEHGAGSANLMHAPRTVPRAALSHEQTESVINGDLVVNP
jgi:hypothetical protein